MVFIHPGGSASRQSVMFGEQGRKQVKKFVAESGGAMQSRIFCLSSWDLIGALPLPSSEVEARFAGGDYRWIGN
jgi:hypothetical protein